MRDKIKTKEYFDRQIIVLKNSITQILSWISNGEILYDRINNMKRAIVWNYISIIGCKYSLELNPVELYPDTINAINTTYESWDGFWKIAAGNPRGSIILDQYGLGGYDQMLWMLSLGYLLDIPNEEFQKLVDVIDRDRVKDFLFEFIIRNKIKDRQPIVEESYQKYFGIPQIFDSLRKAIVETDKTKAELLVKQFVRQWYVKHRSQGWYNSHNSTCDGYYGYWSFETAAVVKIMELDDSSFIDCQYYPKDLIG
jgi:hypothetical protein